MADPTSIVNLNYEQDASRIEALIKTSEVLVIGGFSAIDFSTGLVEFGGSAAGLIPIGVVLGNSRGDNDGLTGDGTEKAVSRGGIVVTGLTVTGVSARTDTLSLVYASDGQTLSLTKPATGMAVGFIHRWISGTTADVYFFSVKDATILSYATGGSNRYEMLLAVVNGNALEGTSAIDLATHTMQGHGKIVSIRHVVFSKDSVAVAGSQLVNLEIDAVDVTGGVSTIAFGDAQGASTAGTAITAANEFNDGSTLQLEMAAGGTGFTANASSLFGVYALIERLPGA